MIFCDLPGETRSIDVLQNSAHAPAFAVVAVLLLRTTQRSLLSNSFLRYAAAWLGAVILGAIVEMIQAALHRDADWHDIFNDALGAACALSIHCFFRGRRAQTRRWAALVLAGFTFALAAWPLTECAAAYALRAHRFPDLLVVRCRLDFYFVTTGDAATDQRLIEELPPWGSTGYPVAIDLAVGEWPGLRLAEVERDWTSYRAVLIDIENPGTQPLALIIRLDDRSSLESDDPFYFEFELPPHTRENVPVLLNDLRRSKSGNQVNLRDMRKLTLFHDGPAAQTMTLHSIRLSSQ